MVTEEKVLDHGYVRYIESWGSDERIIESARMSTDGAFRGWDTDQRLLSFLWRNKHYSPFEFGGLTIEVQAPIFVFREWHRHRTQSYNELSARYTELPDLFYVPTHSRLVAGKQSTKNKQSSEAGFTNEEADDIREDLLHAYRITRSCYEGLIAQGVAREIARLVIPVAQYSRMRASANLRNWLAFLSLRCDDAAQYEIRCYANVVGEIIKDHFPRTWSLFNEEQHG